GERRNAAVEAEVLEQKALFLCALEPADEHCARPAARRRRPWRQTKVAGDRAALELDLDPARGRLEVGRGPVVELHLPQLPGLPSDRVVEPHELRVVDAK